MTRYKLDAVRSETEAEAIFEDISTWIRVAVARESDQATVSVTWLKRLDAVLASYLGRQSREERTDDVA